MASLADVEIAVIVEHLSARCGPFLRVYVQHPIFKASTYHDPADDDARAPMTRALALAVLYDSVHTRFDAVVNDDELVGRHGVHEEHSMLSKLAFFQAVRVEADKYGKGRDRACTFDAIQTLVDGLETTCLASMEGLLTVGEQATLKAMETTYPHKRASLVGVIERAASLRHHDPSSAGWRSAPTDEAAMNTLWAELKQALSHVHKSEMDRFISSLSSRSEHASEDEAEVENIATTEEYLAGYFDWLVFIGVGKELSGEWYDAGATKSLVVLPPAEPCHDGCKTMEELVSASHPLQRCALFSKCAFYFAKLVEKLVGEKTAAWRIAKQFADGELCSGYPDFLEKADLPPARTELNALLGQKWSTWPLSTVQSVCAMCDAEHGARFLFNLASGDDAVDEEWFGRINLFDLHVKMMMAPPMVLQSCMLYHFLAREYASLMDDESTLSWRSSVSAVAIRGICGRTDPCAIARRVSDYFDAAHDGPKIQRLLHPLVRTAVIAGANGLSHWSMNDLVNMLSMIRGWDGVSPAVFPETEATKSMSKRELLTKLMESWFAGSMKITDARHQAKARLLMSGEARFMSHMGSVYKEMCTRGPANLVAFLPDVIFKTKPFVQFVRAVQRHCTKRRPLFSIRSGDFPGSERKVLDGGVMDEVVFNTISRQYGVAERFPVSTLIHPELVGWDQDEAQVDRQYAMPDGAQWNVSGPGAVFSSADKGYVGFDGVWKAKDDEDSGYDTAEKSRVEDRVCAVVWRELNGECQLIGYIAKDDTRDFYDVMACAIGTWASNGGSVQPCCLVVDKMVCAPNHRIEVFATSGLEEADDAAEAGGSKSRQ